MSDDEIERQIADLEATLARPLPRAARRLLERQLAALRQRPAPLIDLRAAQVGDVRMGDVVGRDQHKGAVQIEGQARLYGPAVGVNLGTVIYGRSPDEDERRRLIWYLEGLAAKLAEIPLPGLDEPLGPGRSPGLHHIYVALATESRVEVARGQPEDLRAFFEHDDPRRPLKRAHHPDYAQPDAALYLGGDDTGSPRPEVTLARALSAEEAVSRHRRLALLGEPGSGKSTFLRYLALALALRELDSPQAPRPPEWDGQGSLLPILVPVRALAGRLARDGEGDATVYAALRDELHANGAHQVDDALSAALSRGTALLLFDGLDEVPPQGASDIADRQTTLRAVRAIARRYDRCPVVLTCRARAFDTRLRTLLGWPVETLAPLTGGQVRSIIGAWHSAMAAPGSPGQAGAAALISAIAASPRLAAMSATPLLLTLMVLLHASQGDLPRDRPQLYERILDRMLDEGRPGTKESLHSGGPSTARAAPTRTALDHLAYEAHRDAPAGDWRGRLAQSEVIAALIDHFRRAQVGEPGDAALHCLEHLEQRSGLLMLASPATLAFAHLALQEHCAGRQLVLHSEDPVAAVLRHRGEERWREPIMLGLGLADPLVLDRLLSDLIDPEERGGLKPIQRWHRDLILAAEIGADRDWAALRARPQLRADRLQRDLRRGLVALLADRRQPLPIAERVRAGLLLGDLGDPRFPVGVEEWRHQISQAYAGASDGYFCLIPPAPGRPPRWIARYPITNAQIQLWLTHSRQSPWPRLRDPNFNRSNQPASGITWLMASEFCAWLSVQAGAPIRLPSEAEWDAAAYGDDGRRHPWGAIHQADCAAIKHDMERRKWPYTVPVGCYPAGASAVGALDIAGNVWEWTTEVWGAGPDSAGPRGDARLRVLRGGCFRSKKSRTEAGARIGRAPSAAFDDGFRIVLDHTV